jgi:hypothetical protein
MYKRGSTRTPRAKSSSPGLGSLPENPPCPKSLFPNAPESLQIRLPKSVLSPPQKELFWGTDANETDNSFEYWLHPVGSHHIGRFGRPRTELIALYARFSRGGGYWAAGAVPTDLL